MGRGNHVLSKKIGIFLELQKLMEELKKGLVFYLKIK